MIEADCLQIYKICLLVDYIDVSYKILERHFTLLQNSVKKNLSYHHLIKYNMCEYSYYWLMLQYQSLQGNLAKHVCDNNVMLVEAQQLDPGQVIESVA